MFKRYKKELGWFSEGMRLFGESISAIVNTLLLTLVYIVGIGLTSVVAKMFGKHFLDSSVDREARSYWRETDIGGESLEQQYRQF